MTLSQTFWFCWCTTLQPGFCQTVSCGLQCNFWMICISCKMIQKLEVLMWTIVPACYTGYSTATFQPITVCTSEKDRLFISPYLFFEVCKWRFFFFYLFLTGEEGSAAHSNPFPSSPLVAYVWKTSLSSIHVSVTDCTYCSILLFAH